MSCAALKVAVDQFMQKVPGVEVATRRCLNTERWGGSVVAMVVDAAFTSIGMNYFTAVVPKVEEFIKRYVETGSITGLKELSMTDPSELRRVWKNRRSWDAAIGIARHLSGTKMNDREALRDWAAHASLEKWESDPVGKVKGVGLVTFQYLRMMGGVDTVMPDKIVKRVINEILAAACMAPVEDDMEFIKKTEEMARESSYRPIDLCWMTWLVQPEGSRMRVNKYAAILPKI